MQSFQELSNVFNQHFSRQSFSGKPASLYAPAEYFLALGGKRIRPVLCLMANELFGNIIDDALHASTAIELFHNFTLIHDDIMDNASLRRGKPTVHEKYGVSTALLCGDVIMIKAYEQMAKISAKNLPPLLSLFNTTAKEVCEGQQLDMDFETMQHVAIDDYIEMISLKTSVLLACSLQMGALAGGAGKGNCELLYNFGKNLGIAFQIQDDYLDAFGNGEKVGKSIGGDIKQNKKTFLLIHTLNVCTKEQREKLNGLINADAENKVEQVLEIYKACDIDDWALSLKNEYLNKAYHHLEKVAVLSSRKKPLMEFAEFLVQRDY